MHLLANPGTSTQGAPVFPASSRLGIEPKTPALQGGWRKTEPPAVCVYYCSTYYKAVRVGGGEYSGGHVLRETTSPFVL